MTEQIKERLGVVEVVGEYLRLEKAGSNYKALCPFHNEKNPSFMVNAERNFWYCFGCQKGGDIFTFVQEMEGLDFREALERLAERAGVILPRYQAEDREVKSRKEKVLEMLELATKVYQFYLQKNPVAVLSKKYLEKRGMSSELQDKFRVGYAPDSWHLILDYLKKKGYSELEISATGLLVNKENRTYDRFRGRIMFPVVDVVGRVVGFSARVSPGQDEKSAKYINTPQTIVYDKSKVIFGLYQAKTAIKRSDLVIVVEGNMDVILSHQAGVENVVAVSGTALTLEHARIIKRYTNNIRLCLDMDGAGQKATEKSAQIFLALGMDAEVIVLPEGYKDVGDMVAKNPEEWKRFSSQSKSIMEYYFEQSFVSYDTNDVKQKKQIASRLLNIIKSIADPIEQNYWLRKLSIKLGVEESVLTNVLEKVKIQPEDSAYQRSESANQVQEAPKNRREVLEERLLGLAVLFSDMLKEEIIAVKESWLSNGSQKLWQEIKKDGTSNKLEELALKVKYVYDSREGLVENKINAQKEFSLVKKELEELVAEEAVKKITLDIRRAEEAGDDEAAEILLKELKKLKISKQE
ncbi:MAG TPA: DNA primase [Candidatus Moranbacteria bacterium]|nr:DNA primase [Candidatus Moranbacteria bacterium]